MSPVTRSYSKLLIILLLAALLPACNGNGGNNNNDDDGPVDPPPEPSSSARQADDADELLEGPLARGRSGDYVLENDLLRVVIQQPGREWFGLGTYGGNIIDASARNDDGTFNPDHLEEFIIGINIENTANYTEVEIRNNGEDGEPAVICASGPDDLIEVLNASSQIRSLGAQFPDSADDRDLPLEIETCYSLAPDETWRRPCATPRMNSCRFSCWNT